MLVGMQVPYRRTWQPTVNERRLWDGIRAENRARALTALTIREAYQAISAPEWQWNIGFFQ